MKKVFLCLFLMVGTVAMAQPASLFFYYLDESAGPPLSTPCTQGSPICDGAPICIYWDNDLNGPDADDPAPDIAVPCFTINGEETGLGCGYFASLTPMELTVPETNPVFYLEMSHNATCLRSDTFRVGSGPLDVYTHWHCTVGACRVVTPPPPPTNLTASDDTRCLGINLTWQHVGGGGGFKIYRNGNLVATRPADERQYFLLYTVEGTGQFTATAFNAGGESAASNADAGSTYLMHWSQATLNVLTGDALGGTVVNAHFDTPEDPSACPTEYWVTLLYNMNSTRDTFDIIATGAQNDAVTFTLPDQPLSNCVCVLKDSNYTYGAVFFDTTGIFHLGVAVDAPGTLRPDRYALAQNYPNPFNPTTRIEFSLPTTSDVSINVFNISGQLVKTLVSGSMAGGVHSVEWDGRNDFGQAVSAGVYLYRMTTADFMTTNKMLLLK